MRRSAAVLLAFLAAAASAVACSSSNPGESCIANSCAGGGQSWEKCTDPSGTTETWKFPSGQTCQCTQGNALQCQTCVNEQEMLCGVFDSGPTGGGKDATADAPSESSLFDVTPEGDGGGGEGGADAGDAGKDGGKDAGKDSGGDGGKDAGTDGGKDGGTKDGGVKDASKG